MSLTFTQQKKPTSTLIPAKRGQSDHQATFQPPRAEEALPQPGFGHEFSKVDVLPGERTGPQFSQSCPLSLDTPRACPFGGACHTCPAPVQAKLTISQPGDKYEQEADRVADAVMTIPEPRNGQRLQRECSECGDEQVQRQVEEEEEEEVAPKLIQRQAEPGGPEEEEEEEETIATKLLQRQVEGEEEEEEEKTASAKSQPGHTPQVTPAVTANIKTLRNGGQPLSPSTRAFFEPRFGHDFSRVRVHSDSKAADTTQAVQAKAFTVGRDIVFGASQYAPDTHGGRRLLAHELAHVVQQGRHTIVYKSIMDSSPPILQMKEKLPSISSLKILTIARVVKGVNTKNKQGWIQVLDSQDKRKDVHDYLKVDHTSTKKDGSGLRDHFKILEGPQKDKSRRAKLGYLDGSMKWEGAAAVTLEEKRRKKGTYWFGKGTRISGILRYGGGIANAIIEFDSTRKPLNIGTSYRLLLPDSPHGGGQNYGDYALTWFRIEGGPQGDEYLHRGAKSLGCVTVTSPWPPIYKHLINKRDGDQHIGKITITKARKGNRAKKSSQRRIPRPGYKPNENGCGPENPKWANILIPDRFIFGYSFKQACNKHDRCYGTCNSNKDKCDLHFHYDMRTACDKWINRQYGPKGPFSWAPDFTKEIDRKGCYLDAKIYYLAVSNFGESAFQEAQKQACIK